VPVISGQNTVSFLFEGDDLDIELALGASIRTEHALALYVAGDGNIIDVLGLIETGYAQFDTIPQYPGLSAVIVDGSSMIEIGAQGEVHAYRIPGLSIVEFDAVTLLGGSALINDGAIRVENVSGSSSAIAQNFGDAEVLNFGVIDVNVVNGTARGVLAQAIGNAGVVTATTSGLSGGPALGVSGQILLNSGTVQAVAAHYSATAVSFGYFDNWLNNTGSILASGDGSATGVRTGASGTTLIENLGTIVAQSSGPFDITIGIEGAGYVTVLNEGSISASGSEFIVGARLGNGGLVINEAGAVIEAFGDGIGAFPSRPAAIIAGIHGMTSEFLLDNAGTIRAASTPGGNSQPSVAVLVHSDLNRPGLTLANSGEIVADWAVITSGRSNSQGPNAGGRDQITNSGSIQGVIRTEADNDVVLNSGTIVGDVFLGYGDDRFENTGVFVGVVHGEEGNDLLRGGAGDDLLYGGPGNDRAFGGGGADKLIGGAGSDELAGEGGNDLLYGEDGDDVLDGGAGNDYLSGLNGNDTFLWGGGADIHVGGAGVDTLDYSAASSRIVMYLDGRVGTNAAAGDTALSVENLIGAGFDDQIDASASRNLIETGVGEDRIFGRDGNDVLDGGDGDDRLYGQNGNDRLLGEAGDDELDGGAGADWLLGGTGADLLLAENGNDRAWGGTGNDELHGGGGDDRLYG
jgi:Ca2+-binding RTX toxin-like protein